ncbi:6933_t:CDS:2 [Dentiscutata erythropus]|uniref:6933_t:CDS:1 n=1 Tax=Dentiscutata erythropus TaxID=1348616 RepID=A0A9N8WL11_9GLOM|nr:6933_t:CDS:2 [Dentiscutata erythropus]
MLKIDSVYTRVYQTALLMFKSMINVGSDDLYYHHSSYLILLQNRHSSDVIICASEGQNIREF